MPDGGGGAGLNEKEIENAELDTYPRPREVTRKKEIASIALPGGRCPKTYRRKKKKDGRPDLYAPTHPRASTLTVPNLT